MEVEVVPTGVLLEAGTYIVEGVPDAAVVWAHASVPRYRDCCCEPNVGQMSHEDLMVILGHNINNVVVAIASIRAIEVLKNNFFAL